MLASLTASSMSLVSTTTVLVPNGRGIHHDRLIDKTTLVAEVLNEVVIDMGLGNCRAQTTNPTGFTVKVLPKNIKDPVEIQRDPLVAIDGFGVLASSASTNSSSTSTSTSMDMGTNTTSATLASAQTTSASIASATSIETKQNLLANTQSAHLPSIPSVTVNSTGAGPVPSASDGGGSCRAGTSSKRRRRTG
jgi:hypothetical protein